MPQQISGIVIADNHDGTQSIQIGPSGFPSVNLFDRTFDQNQVVNNMRLAFLIGGYVTPQSFEFIDAINRDGKGIIAKDQTYFVSAIKLIDQANQIYEIGFSNLIAPNKVGPTIFTIQATADTLSQDLGDQSVVIPNINGFLRAGGYANMTQVINGKTAAQAVVAQAFWY
jgi:hypothetical protein